MDSNKDEILLHYHGASGKITTIIASPIFGESDAAGTQRR
jgi:hypothetical protein